MIDEAFILNLPMQIYFLDKGLELDALLITHSGSAKKNGDYHEMGHHYDPIKSFYPLNFNVVPMNSFTLSTATTAKISIKCYIH